MNKYNKYSKKTNSWRKLRKAKFNSVKQDLKNGFNDGRNYWRNLRNVAYIVCVTHFDHVNMNGVVLHSDLTFKNEKKSELSRIPQKKILITQKRMLEKR